MHTLGQGESRDGPIGTLGRSGRRLRTNRSAAVLGCCKNLRFAPAKWSALNRRAISPKRSDGAARPAPLISKTTPARPQTARVETCM